MAKKAKTLEQIIRKKPKVKEVSIINAFLNTKKKVEEMKEVKKEE